MIIRSTHVVWKKTRILKKFSLKVKKLLLKMIKKKKM